MAEKDAALADMLCFSLYSAEHAFTQLYRSLLTDLGVTYPQYLVMVLLWARDGRTVRDIGRALHLKSNTLTPLLKRLEAMQLIARRRDAEDERSVRISLTERGSAMRDHAPDIHKCVAEATGLSARELKQATEIVDRLRDRVMAAPLPNR